MHAGGRVFSLVMGVGQFAPETVGRIDAPSYTMQNRGLVPKPPVYQKEENLLSTAPDSVSILNIPSSNYPCLTPI